ncbi:MAG: hypothetical protein ACREUC_02155 [Steroidobacteraceae bacterium]
MRFIMLVLLLFSAATAHAYVGPGLGLGVIGAILGALLTVILAIAGVVWYPVKRLLKKKNQTGAAGNANTRSEARDRVEKSSEA